MALEKELKKTADKNRKEEMTNSRNKRRQMTLTFNVNIFCIRIKGKEIKKVHSPFRQH